MQTTFDRPIFTSRELDVLRLLAEGYDRKQIAQNLYISLGTVKTHMKNIYAKVDAENPGPKAVAIAFRAGLIQ